VGNPVEVAACRKDSAGMGQDCRTVPVEANRSSYCREDRRRRDSRRRSGLGVVGRGSLGVVLQGRCISATWLLLYVTVSGLLLVVAA